MFTSRYLIWFREINLIGQTIHEKNRHSACFSASYRVSGKVLPFFYFYEKWPNFAILFVLYIESCVFVYLLFDFVFIKK